MYSNKHSTYKIQHYSHCQAFTGESELGALRMHPLQSKGGLLYLNYPELTKSMQTELRLVAARA